MNNKRKMKKKKSGLNEHKIKKKKKKKKHFDGEQPNSRAKADFPQEHRSC
jgi:hypothetical protein